MKKIEIDFKKAGYNVELFRQRLEALSLESGLWIQKKKHPDFNGLAEICGSSANAIKNWFGGRYKNDPSDIRSEGKDFNQKKFSVPDTKYLIKLADYFHVSLDYLLGRSDTRHLRNIKVSKLIGFSDKAVEVLRYMSGNLSFEASRDPDVYDYNYSTIKVMNFILEDAYDDVHSRLTSFNNDFPQVDTLFSFLFQYLQYDPKDHVYANEKITIEHDGMPTIHTRGQVVEGFLERGLFDRIRKCKELYQKKIGDSDSNNLG